VSIIEGVPMEARVQRLEATVSDLVTEVKLTTQALSSIDATLIELKSVTVKLVDIQVATNAHRLMLDSVTARVKVLERRVDTTEDTVTALDKSDAVQGIKIGSAEKFVWALLSAGFTLAVAMYTSVG